MFVSWDLLVRLLLHLSLLVMMMQHQVDADLFEADSGQTEQDYAIYMMLDAPLSPYSIYAHLGGAEIEPVLLYSTDDFVEPGSCLAFVWDLQRIGHFLFARIRFNGPGGPCVVKEPIGSIDTQTGSIEPDFILSRGNNMAAFDIEKDKLYMIASEPRSFARFSLDGSLEKNVPFEISGLRSLAVWNSIVFVGLIGRIVTFRDDQDAPEVTVFATVESADFYSDLHVHCGGGKDRGCFLYGSLYEAGLIHQYKIQYAFPSSPVEPLAEVDVGSTVGSDGITSQWYLYGMSSSSDDIIYVAGRDDLSGLSAVFGYSVPDFEFVESCKGKKTTSWTPYYVDSPMTVLRLAVGDHQEVKQTGKKQRCFPFQECRCVHVNQVPQQTTQNYRIIVRDQIIRRSVSFILSESSFYGLGRSAAIVASESNRTHTNPKNGLVGHPS